MREKFYTLTEAAELLGVKYQTAFTWIKSGKLGAIKVGRNWRIGDSDLNLFIAKSTIAGLKKDGKKQ